MVILLGVGGLILVCGFQNVSVPVVQAGLRLFGRALTAEISAVGVIGQGAVVLVRSAVSVIITSKGDSDGVVGLDITQGKGAVGIAGNPGLPVVAVGLSFHCGIVDILLHNGDGVQGVVFLGLDGKFGIRPGDHMAGRGRDGAVASINRSGDAIGLILHIGRAVAVGVIAPYGVDGCVSLGDIHLGGEDAGIIPVIQAVNGVLFIQRPAHKGHLFIVMIRMGGLEISGIQLVAGLCRDLLGFDRDRSITVEISAVGVIGHGVLGLIDIRCPIVVGVVAPGGIQGGVGVDSVGAEHGGGGGIVGGQDRSGLVNCIRPVDESYRDAVYRAVGGAVGQGYLSAACDVGLGRRDIGHTALNCVAVVSEGKASLRGVISVTDGNGSDYIASRVIHDPPLWGGFISGIRILVSIFVARNCRLSQLIGGSRRDTGNGCGLAGLELEGPIGVQRSLWAIPDLDCDRGLLGIQLPVYSSLRRYVVKLQFVGECGLGTGNTAACGLIYLHRQRPGGGLFGAQAVVAQMDGDCGVVHIIDRVAVVDGGAGPVAGLVGAAVGHTAQLGGACFNV